MNITPGPGAGTVAAVPAHGLTHLLQTLRAWPWFETLRTLRQRFREDRLGLTAGSLTFTTLIALVPLVTVMLAVFSAFPMFAGFEAALQKYFLQNLVPEGIARPVLRALTQFAGKARSMGTLGLLLLLATALALVLTIDRTLNGIWRVRQPRPLGQRVLVYWAALTLGPLALGVSLTITSLAVSASRGLVTALPGGVAPVLDLVQFVLLMAADRRAVPLRAAHRCALAPCVGRRVVRGGGVRAGQIRPGLVRGFGAELFHGLRRAGHAAHPAAVDLPGVGDRAAGRHHRGLCAQPADARGEAAAPCRAGALNWRWRC
jgi:YihY family inner membrane protein